MKTITSKLPLLFIAFLLSCAYPEKKVLIRFADGRPKVIRYYKRGDSLNEKLISYYANGKKEYVKYWKNDTWKYKEYEWYESGAKKSFTIDKFKDTVRTYSCNDSCITVSGLYKEHLICWFESGKRRTEAYSKEGRRYWFNYNEKGEITYKEDKPVGPDGYDSISTHWIVVRKRK